MSDNVDIATEREEMARASAVITSRKPEGPVATGRCLWCDDIVADDVRWCSSECRDAWEGANARRVG